MQIDLLTSEDKQSYFINCKVKGDLLAVGAVFIAASTSSPLQLVSSEGANLVVEIPTDAINQPKGVVAADTSFFIVS
tara:strand:- start:594 stop:824 length:231 start_codon:yes stop_codon:yes gene_type:complete